MKTILIPTDFSDNATHAAEYAYLFAKQLKANIILCNAFVIPVEMPQASMVAWPMYEYDEIVARCGNEVKALKAHLEETYPKEFQPAVKCINEAGSLQDVVSEMLQQHDIALIVMGTHGASGLSGFILGNHSRRMIDCTIKPLLLIPSTTRFKTIQKIAFATDLENIEQDLDAILELINYAKPFNAEILLTYVDNKKYNSVKYKKFMDEILTTLSNKSNYPLIYYRLIESHNAESGLNWLCHHGGVDILAMVHRPHNILYTLIKGSHTQKMAGHISKPLLVFPVKA